MQCRDRRLRFFQVWASRRFEVKKDKEEWWMEVGKTEENIKWWGWRSESAQEFNVGDFEGGKASNDKRPNNRHRGDEESEEKKICARPSKIAYELIKKIRRSNQKEKNFVRKQVCRTQKGPTSPLKSIIIAWKSPTHRLQCCQLGSPWKRGKGADKHKENSAKENSNISAAVTDEKKDRFDWKKHSIKIEGNRKDEKNRKIERKKEKENEKFDWGKLLPLGK